MYSGTSKVLRAIHYSKITVNDPDYNIFSGAIGFINTIIVL